MLPLASPLWPTSDLASSVTRPRASPQALSHLRILRNTSRYYLFTPFLRPSRAGFIALAANKYCKSSSEPRVLDCWLLCRRPHTTHLPSATHVHAASVHCTGKPTCTLSRLQRLCSSAVEFDVISSPGLSPLGQLITQPNERP